MVGVGGGLAGGGDRVGRGDGNGRWIGCDGIGGGNGHGRRGVKGVVGSG